MIPGFLNPPFTVFASPVGGGLPAYEGFQGTVAGYSTGGSPDTSNIDKFPFATDSNATTVGSASTPYVSYGGGQSSDVSGYTSGGLRGGGSPSVSNTIDKFPFASDGTATDVGDLTEARYDMAGHSSTDSGYTSGGTRISNFNIIDKFPFASDGNATDVGDLLSSRIQHAGHSSSSSGYKSGSPGTSTIANQVEKFPFATDTNATAVGDLAEIRGRGTGQSSDASGYTSGGLRTNPTPPSTVITTIDKFPFATDTNATSVGDLSLARYYAAGQSSTASGYSSGGTILPPLTNVIDKFPFASDGTATDVGDLTAARTVSIGQQR